MPGIKEKGSIRDEHGVYVVQRDGLREFNAILQRDAADTTYKYALLRALVEIVEHQYHHVSYLNEDWVSLPLGLIVEKWLYYYYFFIAHDLPQRHREAPRSASGSRLAFRTVFKFITDYYTTRGGMAAFARDLRKKGIPPDIEKPFKLLLHKIRYTITRYPMKHLGFSLYGDHYQVVTFERVGHHRIQKGPFTRETLITTLGTARLRRRYFETFRHIGGFATGTEAIFAQWARFTEKANPEVPVSLADAMQALLTSEEDERNVIAAKELFMEKINSGDKLNCVWTGKLIRDRKALAIDHAIPFSQWGCNALWNLLPVTRAVNASKSDRIPDPELVNLQRHKIIECWSAFHSSRFKRLFESDFRLTLAGMQVDFSASTWGDIGINSLLGKCAYLIDDRGFPQWRPGN